MPTIAPDEKYRGFDPGESFRQRLLDIFGKTVFDEAELTKEFYTTLYISFSDFFQKDGGVDLDQFWSPELREWLLHGDQSADLPLLAMLNAVPPDLNAIKAFLDDSELSTDKITITAIRFIYENCQFESYTDTEEETHHGYYLPGIIDLLLKYGLKPNAEYEGQTIMESVFLVDTGYSAPDSMALLLEHGGDPYLDTGDEPLFDNIEFDIIFGAHNQENRYRYDQWIHLWLVMIGYGAQSLSKDHERKSLVKFFEPPYYDEPHTPFTIEDFKNHRNFYWALTHVPGNGENWSLHIIDKNTGWEVLRL